MKKITSEKAYSKALTEIHHLMKKGENNLTEKATNNISDSAKIIQDYEKVNHPFPHEIPAAVGVSPTV
jgi:antitoxin component HigA of HigAB toxin-antitoxin module